MPNGVACAVTRNVCGVPVIGIGSGPDCDGQVLVTHDILGLSGTSKPSFAKQYADMGMRSTEAVKDFSDDVRAGRFPDA